MLNTVTIFFKFWGEILILLQITNNLETFLLNYIVYFLVSNYIITFYFLKTNNKYTTQNLWIIYLNYIILFCTLKMNYTTNIANLFHLKNITSSLIWKYIILIYFITLIYNNLTIKLNYNIKNIFFKLIFVITSYLMNSMLIVKSLFILLFIFLPKIALLSNNVIIDKTIIIYIFMVIITLPIIILSYNYIINISSFKNWKANSTMLNFKIYCFKFSKKISIFFLIILCIYIILLTLFSTNNLFIFFFTYETTILPIILLLYFYGPKKETKRAIFYYLSYTLLGSIFLIIAIYLIYNETNTLYLNNIQLIFLIIKYKYNKIIFILFFIIFAIKIPIVPFHLWLPEAHVEASTAGSIILAALLLKMGVFGMFKFNISILNSLILYYYPLITILTLFSSIYISILIFQQNDIKKIIAYSSIIHMNVLILGLFSNNDLGIQGSTFTMFSHSLISSGLFLSIGILYKKFETRNLLNYSGFFFKNPLFSFFFLSFLIANCSFPFTSNFAGELYLLLAILKQNIIISIWITISILISPIYSLILYTRIFLGNTNYQSFKVTYLNTFELSIEEIIINIFILSLIIIFGLNPDLIYNFLIKNI